MQVLKKAPTQNPADQTQHKSHTSISQDLAFAIQGNQGFAQDTAMITARRKSTEWSACWKNLLRRYRVRCLPDLRFLELAKGFEPLTL
jgi:hypothetical protein